MFTDFDAQDHSIALIQRTVQGCDQTHPGQMPIHSQVVGYGGSCERGSLGQNETEVASGCLSALQPGPHLDQEGRCARALTFYRRHIFPCVDAGFDREIHRVHGCSVKKAGNRVLSHDRKMRSANLAQSKRGDLLSPAYQTGVSNRHTFSSAAETALFC